MAFVLLIRSQRGKIYLLEIAQGFGVVSFTIKEGCEVVIGGRRFGARWIVIDKLVNQLFAIAMAEVQRAEREIILRLTSARIVWRSLCQEVGEHFACRTVVTVDN